MIRTKGEPGTGDVVQAVRHMRKMNADIRRITSMRTDELFEDAKLIAELSEDLGEAMVGINPSEIQIIMEERGK